MRKFYVYEYRHPVTKVPFYVGKGSGDRYRQHLGGNSHNPHVNYKIAKIRREGYEPDVEIVLKDVSEESALMVEEYLINQYGRKIDGGTLCNLSNGGKGNSEYKFDDEFYLMLGKVTDDEVANIYGCTRSLVTYHRNGEGIPACTDKPNYVPPPNMGGWNKKSLPSECIERLGTISDKKLGEEFGVSKYCIARNRNELGIPSYAATSGNDGRATSDRKLRMDKRIHHFINLDTGEGFIGYRYYFSQRLGVHSSYVGSLVSGKIKKLRKQWVYGGVLSE